ncbi:MAG: hypothetical protein FJX77_01000, partial [Armatimonadetes bacterium]|nr:hypothetical protein [Armatimonadota bacterium]
MKGFHGVRASSRSVLVVGLVLALAACLGLWGAAEAQKKGGGARRGGKSLSGSGFTLQDRGGLDAEAREYLGNARTEAAVKRALKYLSDAQNSDGSWGDSRYSSDVGIVGLCTLAYMSAGHQPDRGPYG